MKNTEVRSFHREIRGAKTRALCDRFGLGPETRESWSGKRERKQAGANGEEGVGCSCFSMPMVLCQGKRERRPDSAVGRRVGLLTRVQGLLYIECRGSLYSLLTSTGGRCAGLRICG